MRYTFETDGILVNPELPENFDFTPNEERDRAELYEWCDKPYIIVEEFDQESWEEHYYRLKSNDCGDPWSDEKIGTKEDYFKELEQRRKSWFKTWYTGFRYDVRCLDGGAWDRSTCHGMFATFEEALSVAKQLKED